MKRQKKQAAQAGIKRGGYLISLFILGILFMLYLLKFNVFKKGLGFYERITTQQIVIPNTAGISAKHLIQLGNSSLSDKRSRTYFTSIEIKKSPNKKRIGFLGCSMTYGLEAPQAHSFPSVFQQKLHASGREDIEVINFGRPVFGLNQMFYLWNIIGKNYDLDTCIINLYHFHRKRDNTFIFNQNQYGFVHGRYIVEQGKLRFIPVDGKSFAETSEGYYQAIPTWKYIQYEAKDPLPVRAILPQGRNLAENPFYYHPDPQAEWKELYAAIIDSIAKATPHVIVMINEGRFNEMKPLLKQKNISFFAKNNFELKSNGHMLYQAQNGHPSSLGYQVLGEDLFYGLYPASSRQLQYIHLTPLLPAGWKATSRPSDLSLIKEMWFSIDSQRLSMFMKPSFFPKHEKLSSFNWEGEKAHALLTFFIEIT
jgi:lysophospholipase L1-like esterase